MRRWRLSQQWSILQPSPRDPAVKGIGESPSRRFLSHSLHQDLALPELSPPTGRRKMRWWARSAPCEVFGILSRVSQTSIRRLFSHVSSPMRTSQPSIADILNTPADPPTFQSVIGFVRTVRKQKHISFVQLGDGSTVFPLQAILKPSQAEGQVPHRHRIIGSRDMLTCRTESGWERAPLSPSPVNGGLHRMESSSLRNFTPRRYT